MTRYDGPIIDAHHHFWEPELGMQPWLRPEADIAFRYGPYDAIKRPYLPPDLQRDAEPFHLVGSVSMETEWLVEDPLGEMRYTARLAERFGLPQAAVAHAVLRDPGVEKTLAELAEMSLVRGIRNKPGQSAGPATAAASPSLLTDPQWRRGYALLRKYGLSFDLQTAWWHMPEAHALAAEHPEQPMIVNHAGLPGDRSREGLAGWTAAIRLMAELPHVAIKVSGIGIPDQPWTVENNRVIVETIAEHFGTDRMMFASNFPVDSLTGTYSEIYGGFIDMTAQWSPAEQRAAFAGNAVKYYHLPPELLAMTATQRGSQTTHTN